MGTVVVVLDKCSWYFSPGSDESVGASGASNGHHSRLHLLCEGGVGIEKDKMCAVY